MNKTILKTTNGLNRFSIKGYCLFDENKNRFFSRKELTKAVKDYWEQCLREDDEEEYKNSDFDFKFDLFKEQFEGYTIKENDEWRLSVFDVWDYTDLGDTWVLVELPTYFGFGIYEQENIEEVKKEIVRLCKLHNNSIIEEMRKKTRRVLSIKKENKTAENDLKQELKEVLNND